jgi:hypothetical protein
VIETRSLQSATCVLLRWLWLLWFLWRTIRVALLSTALSHTLLLASPLLHIGKLLPLFRGENGLDFRKLSLPDLFYFRALLLGRERSVAARRHDLTHLLLKNGLQLCLLFRRELQLVFHGNGLPGRLILRRTGRRTWLALR